MLGKNKFEKSPKNKKKLKLYVKICLAVILSLFIIATIIFAVIFRDAIFNSSTLSLLVMIILGGSLVGLFIIGGLALLGHEKDNSGEM